MSDITSFHGSYSFLSNFCFARVEYQGLVYPTAEHAFQAAKTDDPNWRNLIRCAPTPKEAKRLGRAAPIRPSWDSQRISVMQEILRCKFEQDPELAKKLLATAPRRLVEGNAWHDTFWGVCEGEGENNLGRLLMKLRDTLAER